MSPRFALFACAAWLGLQASGCASNPGFEPTENTVLERADRGEILALHPYPHDPAGAPSAGQEFHGYRVLGRAPLSSKEERDRLIEAMREAIDSSDGQAAKCFKPRHGLRIVASGDTVDMVICFECFQMKVFQGTSEHLVLIGTEQEAELDDALTRHQLTKFRQ